jgi:hypothetical protein
LTVLKHWSERGDWYDHQQYPLYRPRRSRAMVIFCVVLVE